MKFTNVLGFMAFTLISISAFAQTSPIRSCSLKLPNAVPMRLDLYQDKVVTISEAFGSPVSSDAKVSIVQETVRPGMDLIAAKMAKEMINHVSSADSTAGLNQAELLIAQAIMLPLIGMPGMDTGIDLKQVASAIVFLMGEKTNMGQSAVFVGKDKNGKELGSFLAGMIVSPCLTVKK